MAAPTEDLAHKRLVHGARFRALPLNVRCRARCAFCYDRRVAELLPHVRTEYIPPYDEARFDEFRQMHGRAVQWEVETGRDPLYGILPTFERTAGGVVHFPNCDIFSAGLSHEQIEELVRMRQGDVCLLYSVGLDLDPDFVAYLTEAYPDTFRLHLSIVTFDPAIRRRLMHSDIDVDALRRVCSIVRHGTFFLMLFGEEQLAADVEHLLTITGPDNGGLFLHKLYYDRCSPRRVVEYARRAEQEREAAVRRVAALGGDRRSIMCSLGGDVQAFTRRFEIYGMLWTCTRSSDEVILCSGGAHPVLEQYFRPWDNEVVPLESAFGGNVDLVQGLTARSAAVALESLRAAGRSVGRVALPDAMFWLEGGYDVHGDGVDVLRRQFPEVTFDLLEVPMPVICSVVDLADTLAFFDHPDRADFETLPRLA